MPRHMEQDRAGDGVEAAPREGRAAGLRTYIPSETVARVYDAAEKADMTPDAFVRTAIESALGVEDPEVDVLEMNHENATGRVALSAPDTETARRLAEQQDLETAEWIRGTVETAAEQVFQAEQTRQQTEDAVNAAMSGARVPAPDPLGVLQQATDGMVVDPLRAAMTR